MGHSLTFESYCKEQVAPDLKLFASSARAELTPPSPPLLLFIVLSILNEIHQSGELHIL